MGRTRRNRSLYPSYKGRNTGKETWLSSAEAVLTCGVGTRKARLSLRYPAGAVWKGSWRGGHAVAARYPARHAARASHRSSHTQTLLGYIRLSQHHTFADEGIPMCMQIIMRIFNIATAQAAERKNCTLAGTWDSRRQPGPESMRRMQPRSFAFGRPALTRHRATRRAYFSDSIELG